MEQTLGKRIMQNRKRLGLTQDQLAEKLNVTAQAVSKWENDQSCPDITMLPRLADIFGISTDALLGREEPVPVVEAVMEDEPEGLHIQKGKWQFTWDSGKRNAIGFAVGVLAVGILYLLNQMLDWGLSFWNVLWPTALLVYGLWNFPKFSFFRLGCALFGGYSLLVKLSLVPDILNSKVILAVIVVLIGLSLLADALRKAKKPKFQVNYDHKGEKTPQKHEFHIDGESFEYSSSFSENTQRIEMPCLDSGDISCSFGSHTLDLSGVERVSEDCSVDASCAFGQLVILVPKRFEVRPDSAATFAAFEVKGNPRENPEGVIALDASVSFGHIEVRYI